jgi:MULE transposase domain
VPNFCFSNFFISKNDFFFCTGSRYFDLYPEVIGFDVTFGTNKEKRPMARATIKTSSNKNVPFFNALLPSGASWVFRWVFHDALPRLLSKESLANLHLILVDDDHHCNTQIDSARNLKKIPNAQYRLCKWHKVRTEYLLLHLHLYVHAILLVLKAPKHRSYELPHIQNAYLFNLLVLKPLFLLFIFFCR